MNLLDNIGIPKGSVVKTGEKDFSVGSLEGLGLYLNGCDLPQEIYETSDVNELIGQLENSFGETGRLFSWRELNNFTALYFYGTLFDEMNDKTSLQFRACRNIFLTFPILQAFQPIH